ncbi:MAG: SPFH domain-containing protein [Candidatus Caenarcaniphilales bacterium]|nr:SPFH domain-containing protein [Candidatus Caenarcaniphilales bacterium]
MDFIGWIVLGVVVITVLGSFYTVEQQTAAIVERFGQFVGIGNAGLNWKIPYIERVAGRVSLRVEQLDVKVETKTKDNVFVNVVVSVQFFVIPEKVFAAFYRLGDPHKQISSYIFDSVRARVPNIILDNVFEAKDEIADAVKTELTEVMGEFGYSIVKALVTDIDPNAKVKEAMNEINAAQRLRIAAIEKGEAEKILKVKSAEAEAESKALQGKGIAEQRRAIIDGLRSSMDEFQKTVHGASAKDVMTLVLMTQYFDTLKELGHASKSNTILIPHSPGSLSDISDQIRNAMIVAQETGRGDNLEGYN